MGSNKHQTPSYKNIWHFYTKLSADYVTQSTGNAMIDARSPNVNKDHNSYVRDSLETSLKSSGKLLCLASTPTCR